MRNFYPVSNRPIAMMLLAIFVPAVFAAACVRLPVDSGRSAPQAAPLDSAAELSALATPTLAPPPATAAVILEPLQETPVLMCTPPACGPGEVYYCPDECLGGCGTICVPESGPVAAPDAATPDAADAATGVGGSAPIAPSPTDWDALEAWLGMMWRDRVDPAEVRAALRASGMQRDFNDWLSADLNGDLRDEWALVLYDQSMPGAPFGSPGTLWIVGQEGVAFRYYAIPSSDIYEFLAPTFVGLADMTGNGLPELVTDATVCGAHTCYGNYRVIGYDGGAYRDLVSQTPVGDDAPANVITMSYPEPRLADLGEDGRTELLINGGTIGSAAAGIVRPRTEIWAWDGTAVVLSDTQLDPPEYRHHVLYEANDLLAAGDPDGALLLYETAINDGALRDDGFFYAPEETRAAVAQFAAFRLILIDLLKGDAARAAGRLEWLRANHPTAAATQGAAALVGGWAGPEGQAALCAQIETTLGTQDSPTGPLQDMGYGNPGLSAADFCP